jgi:uncharacterized membrane protein
MPGPLGRDKVAGAPARSTHRQRTEAWPSSVKRQGPASPPPAGSLGSSVGRPLAAGRRGVSRGCGSVSALGPSDAEGFVIRLVVLWGRLQESLWFLPSIIVASAILLGVGMVEVSALVSPETLARWPSIFGVSAEGSRSMLSAIAGSMITVAGVTFSITMVAVTQTSTQYSPRILRNFMRDRANQAVLGTFVGIFAYCLVVLRTIREGEDSEFVPSLAVLVGMLLALLGVAVLIFFVHHVATTLQASELVARISRDTRAVLNRLHPDQPEEVPAGVEPVTLRDAVAAGAWQPVPAPRTGYIQRYDRTALVRLAADRDLLFRLELPTGEFVVEGRPLAWFARHPSAADRASATVGQTGEVVEAAARTWVIGTDRSMEVDPGFGFRQLVDVALKALSPGINDSTTALTCIDHLGALLIGLAHRPTAAGARDDAGRLRVLTVEPGFEELLGLAVKEIRQHARDNTAVLERLLVMLGGVATVTGDTRRPAVIRELQLVLASARAAVAPGYDLAQLETLAARTLDAARAGSAASRADVSPSGP